LLRNTQSKKYLAICPENALALNDKAFLESYGSPKPEKDADDVVFHCRTGVRSTKALGIAQSLGYTK